MERTFEAGSAVVVIGHGAGTVVSTDTEKLSVRLAEGDVAVRLADASHLLRALVSREDAERHFQRLCERCTEERTLPALRAIRELTRAPLPQQVEYARWYFRKRKALHGREDEMIAVVGEHVLEELALALEVDVADLRAAVRSGKPVIAPREKRTLPQAPELEGCTFLRSVWLGTRAFVGEYPESDDDREAVSTKPGAWHAYAVAEDEAKSRPEGLLLRHAQLATDAPVTLPAIELGSVNVEGGRVGVLDAAALSDDAFGADEAARLRNADDAYADRGVDVSTLGDGGHGVFVDAKKAATTIYVAF